MKGGGEEREERDGWKRRGCGVRLELKFVVVFFFKQKTAYEIHQ